MFIKNLIFKLSITDKIERENEKEIYREKGQRRKRRVIEGGWEII